MCVRGQGQAGIDQEETLDAIRQAGKTFTRAIQVGLIETIKQPRLINHCVVEWASVAETLEYVAQGIAQDWQTNGGSAEVRDT